MAFLIKMAMGVLPIAALLSAPLFAVGCGGGDDGSERAVEWSVERAVDPTADASG